MHPSTRSVCASAMGLAICLGAGSFVRADWNPGQPAKWFQLPDLSPTGMDVLATASSIGGPSKILADDWLCTSKDPVTDVHLWGSWLNDQLPVNGPGAITVKLSIHADVPAGATPSHPGAELWSAVVRPSVVRPYATAPEMFYDPNTNSIIGTDTLVWQYNFYNLPNPFIQQGTPGLPIVYWLDVQALPDDPGFLFGWKTSIPPHQLDDAVFGDTAGFAGPLLPGGIAGSGWTDMHYPTGPFIGDSMDLSFVITTPEPASLGILVVAGVGLLLRRRHD